MTQQPWETIPPSGSGIPETLFDAKGDLLVGLAPDTGGRLAAGGSDYMFLRTDSALAGGAKWTKAYIWSPIDRGFDQGASAAVNGQAIQDTLDAVTGSGGSKVVIIPPGTASVDRVFDVPSKCYVWQIGQLNYTGAGGQVAFWNFNTGGQGLDGGVGGPGTVKCSRLIDWVTDINCWRNGYFGPLIGLDPVKGQFRVRNNNASNDCDTNYLFKLTGKSDGTFSNEADERPFYVGQIDGTNASGRVTTDNVIVQCVQIPGIFATTISGGVDQENGGIAYEIINSDRNSFIDCRAYGHTFRSGQPDNVCFSKAVLIRNTGAQSASENVFTRLYIEAAPSSGNTNANWVFKYFTVASASTGVCENNQSDGGSLSCSATAANRRIVTLTNGGNQCRWTKYTNPKIFCSDAAQINIGAGCTENYIEQLSATEPFTNNGGPTNNIVSLTRFPVVTLADFFADVNTTGTAEADLFSFTMKANQLQTNGDKLRIHYGLKIPLHATALRNFQVRVGGVSLVAPTAFANSGSDNEISIDVDLIRRNATTIRFELVARRVVSAAPFTTTAQYANGGEITVSDLSSNTCIVKLTGQTDTAAQVVTGRMGSIVFVPAV